MKILLTGAAGFLGSRAKATLEKRGHVVIGTDRMGEFSLCGDLSLRAFVERLPSVDAVIHTAAVQYVSADLPFWKREGFFEQNNVVATQNLLDRYRGSNTHIVNVATSMMYRQDGSSIYTVKSAIEGQGVYSRSKVEALRLVESSGLPNASVVPCIIGGPGREGLFRAFVSTLVRYGFAVFPGKGMAPIGMVDVDDVADLVVAIVERRAIGRYNAAAPGPLSISDWVWQIAAELSIRRPLIVRIPSSPIYTLAALTRYRLLAREQLLMLKWPHVLDTRESEALGWRAQVDNAQIARSIGRYISDSM